jgi:hypothetical protein
MISTADHGQGGGKAQSQRRYLVRHGRLWRNG